MIKTFYTITLVSALAFSGSAFASSVDADMHGLCMKDGTNTDTECSCAVDLVKSKMAAEDYTLLHALATTEEGSDARNSMLASLHATPEKMHAMGKSFGAITGEMKSKCNVSVNNGGDEG